MWVHGEAIPGTAEFELSLEGWPEGQVQPIKGIAVLEKSKESPVPVSSEWMRTHRFISEAHVGPIRFSPDGKTLAVSLKTEIALIDTQTWQERRRFPKLREGDASVFQLVYSSDSQRLFIPIYDYLTHLGRHKGRGYVRVELKGGIMVHQVNDGKPLEFMKSNPPRAVSAISLNADQSLMARQEIWIAKPFDPETRINETDYEVNVLRLSDGQVLWQKKLSGQPMFFPNSNRLLVSSNPIQVIDGLTGKMLQTLPSDRPNELFHSMGLTPDEQWVVATNESRDCLLMWNLRSDDKPKILYQGKDKEMICASAISRDGRRMALAVNDAKNVPNPSQPHPGRVVLLEMPTGRMLQTLTGHIAQCYALDFSPDGQTLATGGRDGTLRLWDVSKLK